MWHFFPPSALFLSGITNCQEAGCRCCLKASLSIYKTGALVNLTCSTQSVQGSVRKADKREREVQQHTQRWVGWISVSVWAELYHLCVSVGSQWGEADWWRRCRHQADNGLVSLCHFVFMPSHLLCLPHHPFLPWDALFLSFSGCSSSFSSCHFGIYFLEQKNVVRIRLNLKVRDRVV